MDQIVANKIGGQTRFPSLEIGLEDARQSGDCDSGYSCAYTNNLAWRSETQPLPPILDPRALFERLFGNGVVAQSRSARARRRSTAAAFSISSPTTPRSSKPASGPPTAASSTSIFRPSAKWSGSSSKAEKDNAQIDPHMDKPYGVPADFAEHFKLMTDMMTIAFQADLTRVMTFLVTHEGTSRAYREIGIPDGHHPLTHHRNQADLMEKVAQINCYHMKQFAGWVEKLKSIKEGDGTLLDNSMIVYGAGLSDGNRHLHEDLPTLIAGSAGNTIKTGRRVVYRRETPMCNLFLSMMDRMGVHMEHFGDSTGKIDGLDLT